MEYLVDRGMKSEPETRNRMHAVAGAYFDCASRLAETQKSPLLRVPPKACVSFWTSSCGDLFESSTNRIFGHYAQTKQVNYRCGDLIEGSRTLHVRREGESSSAQRDASVPPDNF